MEDAQWKWVTELPPEEFPEPYQTIAFEIGVRNTVKLAKHWAGTGMYFPKLDDTLAKMRNKKIRDEFTGANHKALATKYGITERWVYEILKDDDDIDKNQVSMFETLEVLQ